MRRVVHPGGVITWELTHNAPPPVPPQLAIAYMEPTHLVRPRRAPAAAQPAAPQLAVVHLHRRVGQRSLEPTHLVRPTPRVLQAPAEQSPAKVAKVAALREAVAKADAEAGALAVALADAETAAARDAVALQEAITLREAVKVAVATGDCRLAESPSPPPSPAGPAEALEPDAIALRVAMRSPEWLASCSTMAALTAPQLAVVHLEPTHLVRPTQSPAKVAKVAALREAVAKADAEAGALAVALADAETAAARDAVALQEAITLREAVKVAVATGDCRLTESPSPPPSPAGPAEALDPDAIALREAMRSPEWLALCSTMAARAAELHTAVAASTEPPAVVAITEPQDSDIEPQEGDERSASEAD